jgi:hypothetical protein
MIAPALIVGAALVAWGYAGNSLVLGAALAIAYELARALGPRETALGRHETLVVRLTVAAVVILFVGAGITQAFPGAIYLALRGLPVALLPLALLQVLAPRRLLASGLDLTHLLGTAALVGAAATDPNATWFYAVAAILVSIAILVRAPRRAPAAAMLVAAAGLGFAIHTGLSALQSRVEDWSTEFIQELLSSGADPFRERTRIGEMGRVKLSDRIAMRVIPGEPRPEQVLLREAAFDSYVGGEWRATQRTFVPREASQGAWALGSLSGASALTIRRAVPRNEGVLALPPGTARIPEIPGASLAIMSTGTVRALGLPSFVALPVAYDPGADFAGPPSAADLEVPEALRAPLAQFLAEARIAPGSPRETEGAIRRFFAEHYGYTLNLSDGRGGTRSLRDFLLVDRKGHCEYFATASALLLRQAGIPARYTVGFSAQEYSALERAFVVRDRHAHAWTSAWIDGRWVEVDNTPSRWADFEEQEARAWYGPVLDAVSFAIDAIRRHVIEAHWDLGRLATFGVALVLAGALVEWLRRRRPWRRTAAGEKPHAATLAWRRIEADLARRGLGREDGETPRAYAERLEGTSAECKGLAQIARHYYAARFDPASTEAANERFAKSVDGWFARPSAGR